MYLGIPLSSALSVAHGYLPPHPAPTSIAQIFGAGGVELNVFFMDAKRNPAPASLGKRADAAMASIREYRPGVLIASDDDAVKASVGLRGGRKHADSGLPGSLASRKNRLHSGSRAPAGCPGEVGVGSAFQPSRESGRPLGGRDLPRRPRSFHFGSRSVIVLICLHGWRYRP
jgi:hypothetical protein